jgi:hypothetical protein
MVRGHDSDLRPQLTEDPLPYWIHTCPACSLTSGVDDFAEHEVVRRLDPGRVPDDPPPRVKHVFEGEELEWPIVSLVSPPYRETSRRYAMAAHAARERGATAHTVANCHLRASWAAKLAGDEAFARRSQREARDRFVEAASADEDRRMRLDARYLAGELSRRLGEHDRAMPSHTEGVPYAASRRCARGSRETGR